MPVEDIQSYGVRRLDDDEIDGLLTERSVGVLGVPTDGAPLLRPMSYDYVPPDRLYFLYILSESSRKEAATEEGQVGRFLVYDASARYEWASVLLTGSVSAVPEDERGAIEETIDIAWRPEAFESVSNPRNTRLYAFEVTDRSGVAQRGPPPGYEPEL